MDEKDLVAEVVNLPYFEEINVVGILLFVESHATTELAKHVYRIHRKL
jgi:hypothetical protein